MSFPIRLEFGVAAGIIVATIAIPLLFRLVLGLFGLILSLAIPLLVVGALAYIVMRILLPRGFSIFRLLGR